MLLILAVLVQAAAAGVLAWRGGGVDAYAFRSLDAREYYQIARNVAQHGAFSQSEEPPLEPDTWRTPGYPVFLAGLMLVLGDSPARLVMAQQVLSIANVWLVYLVACRHMSSRRAALAAGLFMLEPYRLFYSLWLMASTLFTTLLLLTWWAWCRALDRPRWWWFAAVGGLCGATMLVWQLAALVPVALALGAVFIKVGRRAEEPSAPAPGATSTVPGSGGDRSVWRRIGGSATLAAACVLVLAPWLVRIDAVAGRLSLSHQSGIVLAYFKAAEVELWRQGRTSDRYVELSTDPSQAAEPHVVWEQIDGELRRRLNVGTGPQADEVHWPNLAQGNKTSFDSFVVSGALTHIAIRMLFESPLSTAACWAWRCVEQLTFPLDLALGTYRGVSVNRTKQALIAVPNVALVAAVLVRLLRRRFDGAAAFMPLAATLALLVAAAPQIDPRFRVPMIPLLLVFALLPRGMPTSSQN